MRRAEEKQIPGCKERAAVHYEHRNRHLIDCAPVRVLRIIAQFELPLKLVAVMHHCSHNPFLVPVFLDDYFVLSRESRANTT
mmetsp:Transcript_55172/g.96584  ORF Transcript_55172/g.96584 Transcript_55172/m.96584 type:complete len:82 (+) Transcript_55172:702-947(+)